MSKSGLLARQKAERELEKRDTKDNEYAIAKQEAALKAACGKYYSPREVRYDIKIVTRDGKQHKL